MTNDEAPLTKECLMTKSEYPSPFLWSSNARGLEFGIRISFVIRHFVELERRPCCWNHATNGELHNVFLGAIGAFKHAGDFAFVHDGHAVAHVQDFLHVAAD